MIDIAGIKLYHGECAEVMRYEVAGESVDLVVTSPPYDALRTYKGYEFDFEDIAYELSRVLKPGGVIVWVVGDEVIKRSESGTSFRQALFFMEECELLLHDTMIYEKNGSAFPAPRKGNRYTQIFEYMFVLSKGKPKTAKLICDKKNKWEGWSTWGQSSVRTKSGELVKSSQRPVPKYSARNNIWKYSTGAGFGTSDKDAFKHPATYPDKLAADHILTWSNEGDVVLDPMMGSGTTGVMAKLNHRDFIGIEISKEYFEVAKKRLRIQEYRNKDRNENILEI